MVLADIAPEKVCSFTGALRDRVYELEIENDCVLSLCIVSEKTFLRYEDVSPFYRNILRDGVNIAIQ